MVKIIVEIEGGLVQNVQSTDPNIEVLVLDRDIEGLMDDELENLVTRADIERFLDGARLVSVAEDHGLTEAVYDDLID